MKTVLCSGVTPSEGMEKKQWEWKKKKKVTWPAWKRREKPLQRGELRLSCKSEWKFTG